MVLLRKCMQLMILLYTRIFCTHTPIHTYKNFLHMFVQTSKFTHFQYVQSSENGLQEKSFHRQIKLTLYKTFHLYGIKLKKNYRKCCNKILTRKKNICIKKKTDKVRESVWEAMQEMMQLNVVECNCVHLPHIGILQDTQTYL